MPILAKPVAFDPYGRRRSSWKLPRWLVLLILGAVAGAAAVVLVQQRYMAPRLSAAESQQLMSQATQAEAEQLRLERELAAQTTRAESASTQASQASAELDVARTTLEKTKADMAALIDVLPPDPRGGEVQVRSARFRNEGGRFAYEVVLTRRTAPRPLEGTLKLVVAGDHKGRETSIVLDPQPVSVGEQEVVQGTADLPEHFTPRQTAVQVVARAGGRTLGTRVLFVE